MRSRRPVQVSLPALLLCFAASVGQIGCAAAPSRAADLEPPDTTPRDAEDATAPRLEDTGPAAVADVADAPGPTDLAADAPAHDDVDTAAPVDVPEPVPDVPEALVPSHLTAVWAQEGGAKIAQEVLPATTRRATPVSSTWDGSKVTIFGARNEVVAFALMLEAGAETVDDVTVALPELTGPGGARIVSKSVSGNGVFDWTGRQIELFRVRYLPIKGISQLTWSHYDERHVPERFRRPHGPTGIAQGGWTDRPDHDRYYPDIAVPLELAPNVTVAKSHSQMIWVDVYVPKGTPAGLFAGQLTVREGGGLTHRIPVELTVRGFELPDRPTVKTMIQVGYPDVNQRYVGTAYPNPGPDGDLSGRVRDRHFQMAHRHRLTLVDINDGPTPWPQDAPRPEWHPRLDGTLYTAARGYEGPGAQVGNDLFVIGMYGAWSWKGQGKDAMWQHTDAWATWFQQKAPDVEVLLYLIDESSDFPAMEQWAGWIRANPGPGKAIRSFATIPLPDAVAHTPSLDVPASTIKVADTPKWVAAATALRSDTRRRLAMYNGGRPASGTFATEDEGVALRSMAWAHHKLGVHRWFAWESTYYNRYQGGTGQNNVFQNGHTFGGITGVDPVMGETGWNYTNGDGVLFYPGTDKLFPSDSYGVEGPLASLRLKHWRRGIQDVEYVVLARAVDAAKTDAIVQKLVPKVLWEVGVDDPNDPSYKKTDISWPTDPETWEAARRELADIIASGAPRAAP